MAGHSRRAFIKQAVALPAAGSASMLVVSKEAAAMTNPDYAMKSARGRLKIDYYGMSCFLITASNGIRVVTDPFFADLQLLHSELNKEPADIVTVSCGHYAHCYVWSVGGFPYIYQITEPTVFHDITFRGVTTRHLTMSELAEADPGENIVMCFEVDKIRFCHLGALGHKLSDEQVKQIGSVDILMVPVGGVSTLPLADADEVCRQIHPKVIIPMNYRSERAAYPAWAPLDDFLKGKNNVLRFENKGFNEITFTQAELPLETQIIAPDYSR
jgi:L-ascorbate metabolism protein UlaG (beta-lactamase superfamily)